ncbi:hypothetical protein SKAU_G00150580 [Synaphobranchus kaupii]|uniref:Uncharacterized protein n=1 Tax=Synaphobranchus kaupii TaxID=118154 RepID=A0A9Q1IYD4_SYNKA|nr:hypothetical protein SKAU_G00150580 [Synaphobranchus kaupii]
MEGYRSRPCVPEDLPRKRACPLSEGGGAGIEPVRGAGVRGVALGGKNRRRSPAETSIEVWRKTEEIHGAPPPPCPSSGRCILPSALTNQPVDTQRESFSSLTIHTPFSQIHPPPPFLSNPPRVSPSTASAAGLSLTLSSRITSTPHRETSLNYVS